MRVKKAAKIYFNALNNAYSAQIAKPAEVLEHRRRVFWAVIAAIGIILIILGVTL